MLVAYLGRIVSKNSDKIHTSASTNCKNNKLLQKE